MRVGDLVYIPFIDDKGTLTKGILTREVKEKDGKLFVVNPRLFRKVRTENTNFIR